MPVEHSEAVVLGRQGALADGVDGDVDGHRGATQLLLPVVLGQGGLEGPRLPGGEAEDAVDDRRDHLLTVELQFTLLRIAAAQDLVAAAHDERAPEDVAGLSRPVDVGKLCVATPRPLDGFLDALVSDLGCLHRNAERLVVAQVDLGFHGHRGGELQRLVALELAEVQLRDR